MSKTIDKAGAIPGLAKQAESARTSAEWAAVIERLKPAVDRAQSDLTDRDRQREDVYLTGVDPVAFHRGLHDAMERLKTLEASLAKAEREYEAAVAREGTEQLEEQTRLIHEVSVPAYKRVMREVHESKVKLTALLKEQATHLQAIRNNNHDVKMRDRPDLVVNDVLLRERLGQELRGETKEETVEAEAQAVPLPPEPKGHPEFRQVVENGRPKIVQAWSPPGHINPPLAEMNEEQRAYAAERGKDAIAAANAELIEAPHNEDNRDPADRTHGIRQVQQSSFRDGSRRTRTIDGLGPLRGPVHAENADKFHAAAAQRLNGW